MTPITFSEFVALVSEGAKYKFFETTETIDLTICKGGLKFSLELPKTILNKTTRIDETNPDYTTFDTTYRSGEVVMLGASSTVQPFANKVLENGQKLYRRKHGLAGNIPANSSAKITLIVPYATCKMDKIEVVGGQSLDKVNLKVLDTTTGNYSGTPNLLLNQFGFNVYVAANYYEDHSNYDAELYLNMQIELEYFNDQASAIDIGFNVVFHEML